MALTGCTGIGRQRAGAGKALSKKSDFNAAVMALKTGLVTSPNDGEMRFLLAAVYIDAGNALPAEKEIRIALKLGYSVNASMPVLGRFLLLQGKFQSMLDETEQAAASNGADLLSLRGDAYLAMGKHAEAGQLYAKVVQAAPVFSAALIGLGRLALLDGDTEAVSRYGAGDHSSAPFGPCREGYLEIGLGKFEAAQADVNAARQITPGSVLVAYTQTLLDFSQGKNVAAQESMQKVLRVAPEHMPSILLAGAIDFNLGSLHQAEHYLQSHPENVYARKTLASTLLRSGHNSDALIVLAPALKDAQQDVQLLALAGESSMQARDFTRAAAYFDQAATLQPRVANLRTSLALNELAKDNSLQGINDLQLATRLDGSLEKAGIALVRTQLGLKDFGNAYAAVMALELAQPNNAVVQDLKGMVFIGMQDPVRGRASFSKALALQPSYSPWWKIGCNPLYANTTCKRRSGSCARSCSTIRPSSKR